MNFDIEQKGMGHLYNVVQKGRAITNLSSPMISGSLFSIFFINTCQCLRFYCTKIILILTGSVRKLIPFKLVFFKY